MRKKYLAYLVHIDNDNQFSTFIKRNTTNEVIGVIKISKIVECVFKPGYLGYNIFPKFDKQGSMREASELLVTYVSDS